MPDGFEAIAHPTRRGMLELLSKRNLSAGEIGHHFDITHPAISNHLNVLVNSGLVSRKREEQFIVYTINRDELKKLISILDDIL